MALKLLLDEQITPKVAYQIQAKQADIPIISLHNWQEGSFLGVSDTLILEAAQKEGWTLVTYDQKTIPPVLIDWANTGKVHSGVVFVDYSSIPSNNIGRLVRSLIFLWKTQKTENWLNRIVYLNPAYS